MPENFRARTRYIVINNKLTGGRYATIDDIIFTLSSNYDINVSKRTIEKDIHDMKLDRGLSYYAPIVNVKDRGYHYDDSDYSIDKLPVNENDIEALTFAGTLLGHYKNIDIFKDISGTVQKIVNAVNIKKAWHDDTKMDFIEFETIPDIKGSEFLMPLIKYIKDKKVIDLAHKRFNSDKEHLHTIHPYFLKEHHNRWYLLGWNDSIEEIRTYGLDRISKIEENYQVKYIERGFDSKEYFKDAVGIIAPQTNPENVQLKFTKTQGKYILTLPIHDSQKIIKETKEYLIISLNVNITYELTSMILHWGKDVEVLKPLALRNEISNLLKQTLKNYK